MLHRSDVLHLFRSQFWVASTDQLYELGVSRRAVHRARATGVVTTVGRGVLGVEGVSSSFEARAMAAQLAGGPDAYLSGTTAGALHGLRSMPRRTIEITVPERRSLKPMEGVRIVRTSWADVEHRTERDDPLEVASPLRTMFGLAAQLDQRRFERAAEDLWHRGLVAPTDAATYLEQVRRRGRTGVTRIETWLDKALRHARPATTGLEQLLVSLAQRAGLPEPVRQHPLTLRSGVTIHLDLAWPEVRFALEPGHSWWHGGNEKMAADQARDRACAEVGWMVLRFDESVWTRQARETDRLRRAYQQRCRDLHR